MGRVRDAGNGNASKQKQRRPDAVAHRAVDLD
jgi:hypothetical protein